MTLQDVLLQGERALEAEDVPEAKLTAWYLFSHCFQVEKSYFFMNREEEAPPEEATGFYRMVERRCQRIPLEYITNETEFMGLPFYVDERVLIPRQDTECLVEEVLKVCEGKDVLDLGTGSGCIGISLAFLGNCRSVTLSDISRDALDVAEKNAGTNGVAVGLLESDLFQKIEGEFDIIVSNPPYIASGCIPDLMPEVRDHEPGIALDGSADGLAFYRSIIAESRRFLRENGNLFFEIGYDQGKAVSENMEAAGFQEVRVKRDLAGLDRIVYGQIGGKNV